MHEPYTAADGLTYERSAIEAWIKHQPPGSETSPVTGGLLGSRGLSPNCALRDELRKYLGKAAQQQARRGRKGPAKKLPSFSQLVASADCAAKRAPQVCPVEGRGSARDGPRAMTKSPGCFQTSSHDADEFKKSIERMDRSSIKQQPEGWAVQTSNLREASRAVADWDSQSGGSLAEFNQAIERADRSVRTTPDPGLVKGPGTSREASRMVADSADPEGNSAGAPSTPADAVGKVFRKTAPVNWTSFRSRYLGLVAELGPPDASLRLYPYGIVDCDVSVSVKEEQYAEPHGDGLLSIESAEFWTDIAEDALLPGKRQDVFVRRPFPWRRLRHRLLGHAAPSPESGVVTETAFRKDIVEIYAGIRETSHHLIVIPEVSQCWLLAELADAFLPDPPKVFTKRGKSTKGKGWHIEVKSYAPDCKFFLLPRPLGGDLDGAGDAQSTTVARVLGVAKVNDAEEVFEAMMTTVKAASAAEFDSNCWLFPKLFGGESKAVMTMEATDDAELAIATEVV